MENTRNKMAVSNVAQKADGMAAVGMRRIRLLVLLTGCFMLLLLAGCGMNTEMKLDGEFKTPAAENMVYQNFPAIVFGFPMMLLATLAPVKPLLCLFIFIGFFAVMNVILFRRQIFRKKS